MKTKLTKHQQRIAELRRRDAIFAAMFHCAPRHYGIDFSDGGHCAPGFYDDERALCSSVARGGPALGETWRADKPR